MDDRLLAQSSLAVFATLPSNSATSSGALAAVFEQTSPATSRHTAIGYARHVPWYARLHADDNELQLLADVGDEHVALGRDRGLVLVATELSTADDEAAAMKIANRLVARIRGIVRLDLELDEQVTIALASVVHAAHSPSIDAHRPDRRLQFARDRASVARLLELVGSDPWWDEYQKMWTIIAGECGGQVGVVKLGALTAHDVARLAALLPGDPRQPMSRTVPSLMFRLVSRWIHSLR